MQRTLNPPQKNSHTRLVLGLLFLIALGPFLFAWTIYTKSDHFHLQARHEGELIQPPLLTTPLVYHDLDGQTFTGEDLLGKWWLLYVTPTQWGVSSDEWLHQMRQIHIALGKNNNRMGRLLVADPGQNLPLDLQAQYPHLRIASVAHTDKLYYFLAYATPEAAKNGAMYLVDPRGHLVLHYPATASASGMLEDINRLLRISQIG